MKTKPDLRGLTIYVKCIKNTKDFKINRVYKIENVYGDPERAIREFNINKYLPIECTAVVWVFGDDDKVHRFVVNPHYSNNNYQGSKLFKDYFDLLEYSDKINKFNL